MKTVFLILIAFSMPVYSSVDCVKVNTIARDVSFLSGYIFGRAMRDAGLTKAQITLVLEKYKTVAEDADFVNRAPEYGDLEKTIRELGCQK